MPYCRGRGGAEEHDCGRGRFMCVQMPTRLLIGGNAVFTSMARDDAVIGRLLVGGAIYNNMAEATAMEEDVRRGRNRTETSGGSRDDVGDVQLNSHLSLRDSIRISGTGTGSVHSPRDRTRDAI